MAFSTYIIFNVTYKVERNAHPSESLFRMETVKVWRKVGVSIFSSPVSTRNKREGATPCYQTTSAKREGGRSFDDALETPTWGIVF